MNYLFDTHVHLTDPPLVDHLAETLSQADSACVTHLLVPSYSTSSIQAIRQMKTRHPRLYTALGLHPMYNHEIDQCRQNLARFISLCPWNAIGETGLDLRKGAPDLDFQINRFKDHIDLARELDRPMIVHCVRGHQHCLKTLKNVFKNFGPPKPGSSPGVIHRASCSVEESQEYMKMDFYFSFGPDCLDPRRIKLKKLIEAIPLERILLETDAPYSKTTDSKMAGPWYLSAVAQEIARLKLISDATVIETTYSNALDLFGEKA